MDIYDLIRFYEGEVKGVVVCKAFSSAIHILQACSHRACAEHAEILIHNTSTLECLRLEELLNHKILKKYIKSLEKSTEKVAKMYQRTTGKSLNKIRKRMNKNKPMSPQEAFDFGLIDEII